MLYLTLALIFEIEILADLGLRIVCILSLYSMFQSIYCSCN